MRVESCALSASLYRARDFCDLAHERETILLGSAFYFRLQYLSKRMQRAAQKSSLFLSHSSSLLGRGNEFIVGEKSALLSLPRSLVSNLNLCED